MSCHVHTKVPRVRSSSTGPPFLSFSFTGASHISHLPSTTSTHLSCHGTPLLLYYKYTILLLYNKYTILLLYYITPRGGVDGGGAIFWGMKIRFSSVVPANMISMLLTVCYRKTFFGVLRSIALYCLSGIVLHTCCSDRHTPGGVMPPTTPRNLIEHYVPTIFLRGKLFFRPWEGAIP